MTFFNIFSKKQTKTKKLTKIKIIADNRERNSLVISEIINLGIEIEFKQLPVADYLVNNSIAIERKTISDFKSSIINKRIISQLAELKQYPSPILIIEGIESNQIYEGVIHENAFRGFILSIVNDYKIPIIFTLNEKDTAKYIAVLTKKKAKKDSAIRATKILLTDKEQLQFIMEGFPNVGPTTAKKLLSHYKNIKNFINTSEEELKSVMGKKAEAIYKLINFSF